MLHPSSAELFPSSDCGRCLLSRAMAAATSDGDGPTSDSDNMDPVVMFLWLGGTPYSWWWKLKDLNPPFPGPPGPGPQNSNPDSFGDGFDPYSYPMYLFPAFPPLVAVGSPTSSDPLTTGRGLPFLFLVGGPPDSELLDDNTLPLPPPPPPPSLHLIPG